MKKSKVGKPIAHPTRVMSNEDVRNIGAVQKKYGVTEKDATAAFPGKKEIFHTVPDAVTGEAVEVPGPRADGFYEWRIPYKTNDGHGRLTEEASRVQEMMTPFWRADTERHGKLQSREERVALKDEAGSAHYVPTYKAEDTERRNGWRAGHRLLPTREDRKHSKRCRRCGELPYWCEC